MPTARCALPQGPRRGRALLRLRRAHGRAREDRLAPGVLERRPARRATRRRSTTSTRRSRSCSRCTTASRTGCSSTTRAASRSTSRKADPERITATAAGALVYYVFAGPTPRDVLERYTRADRPDRAAAAVGARQPAVAVGLHGRRRGARDRARLPRARHPVRRHLPRHRPHGRLPRLHVRRRALPRPARRSIAELEADGFKVVCITDPGVKVDEDYARLRRRAASATCYCKTARRRRVPQRRLARACARSRTSRTRPRASGGATSRRRCSTRAWPASGATWTSRRCSSPTQSTMPDDVVHPGGGEPRLHARGPQPLRLADGARRARGPAAAAAGAAPVRDHPRRLRRAAAPRAPVDGRQLVLVGAPVDEHAAAAEPRPVRRRASAASTSAASSATATASCWRAGPSSGSSSRSAATTPARAPCAQEPWAFGEPWETRLPRHAPAADAAAAVPVRALRRGGAHRRADPAPAAVRASRTTRRPTPPTTSSCSATRCWSRRSRGPGIEHRHVYLPAGHVGAVVDRRA